MHFIKMISVTHWLLLYQQKVIIHFDVGQYYIRGLYALYKWVPNAVMTFAELKAEILEYVNFMKLEEDVASALNVDQDKMHCHVSQYEPGFHAMYKMVPDV